MTSSVNATTRSAPGITARKRPTAVSHDCASEINTGALPKDFDPNSWRKRCEKGQKLREQTARLADQLEDVEVRARNQSNVTAISAVTGQIDKLESYRSLRFLPAVAQRDRRPMLNALQYWLGNRRGAAKYTRYAVVTFGEPIHAFGELRQSISALTRKISKWAHAVDRKFDIDALYRGIEYTRKIRENDTTHTYHLHANVLYLPNRVLEDSEWNNFLNFSKNAFGAHWKDNGTIKDLREIVKYVIKPDELEGIEGVELHWLFQETFKSRLSAPLGPVKIFCRDLAENHEKIAAIEGAGLRCVEKSKRLAKTPDRREDDEDAHPKCGEARNEILGITLPQRRHSPWAEPVILVRNFDPDAVGPAADEFRHELELLCARARYDWDRSGAPDPATALRLHREWLAGAQTVPPPPDPAAIATRAREQYERQTERRRVVAEQQQAQETLRAQRHLSADFDAEFAAAELDDRAAPEAPTAPTACPAI